MFSREWNCCDPFCVGFRGSNVNTTAWATYFTLLRLRFLICKVRGWNLSYLYNALTLLCFQSSGIWQLKVNIKCRSTRVIHLRFRKLLNSNLIALYLATYVYTLIHIYMCIHTHHIYIYIHM